jgi:hypothetical protein
MSDSELTNIDIALYALYDLGGHEKKVHTEEVAYRAYELAEERFGWRLPRCFYLHKKMREFVSEAHAVMLKDDEVSILTRAVDADRAQPKRADIGQGSHVKEAVLGGN